MPRTINTSSKQNKSPFLGKETNLVSQILNYFSWSKRYKLIRINSGLARQLRGEGIIHLAPKGTPDILGFDKMLGRIIAIETKVRGNKLSSEQAIWAKDIRESQYGVYILARSLDDVLTILEPRKPLPF